MACKEVSILMEENVEGSNDSLSNSGSSAEPKAKDKNNHWFSESCPAVPEPSKDESRGSDGRLKNLLRKLFTRSCPQPSTPEVSISSSGESHAREDRQPRCSEHRSSYVQQTDETHTNCCASFMNSYSNYARKIKDSWFIPPFLLFIESLCVSDIVMGIIFFRSCEGIYPSTDPHLAILIGIFGLLIVYIWLAQVCRQRSGKYYWNRKRNRIIMCLVDVFFFRSLEFMSFTQMLPKALQSKREVKCVETYYDCWYYMHIVNAGSLVLAALLYLPDCCVYTYQHLVPSHTNGMLSTSLKCV